MIEAVSNHYSLREIWQAVFKRREPEVIEPEILQPVRQAWLPKSEVERTVAAALLLAGEPVNNRRLAELMGCSPSQASKRVAQLEGVIHKQRQGREVLLSLPSPN